VTVLVAVLAAAGCGRPEANPQAEKPGIGVPPETSADVPRAAPRWETVSTLSSTNAGQVVPLAILPDAIQWRVRWSCESGSLRMTTTPPPRRGGPLVSALCPGKGEAFSIVTGSVQLGIEASGPWTAVVDQQIDRALDEPAPPELASATVVGQGSFYGIEKTGTGTARLYRLGDGRRFLRLEGFTVSHNTDLFVWLSESAEPKTSAEALAAPKVVLGNLKSTLGNQNYEIPQSVSATGIRSIVIWCEPVAIAYSAAAFRP
jgi:hypothetical protein